MKINVSLNPQFKEVNQSRKRYIALKGSAGSGKSVDTATNYIIRLMNEPGRNLVCVRKSDVTNRDSTFAELKSAIFNMFGADYSKYWKITSSPLSIRCFNGNQIIFRGMNDDSQREKLKSITFDKGKLTDFWLEEATELTQDDFEIIDDRLRGQLPDGLFYQIKMTFNPVSATHWIKKQFFDRCDENTLAHSSNYQNNRFIDEQYKERMLRRKEVDPDGYRIYGLGEWGETGGLILHNWQIQEVSQDFNDYDEVAIGQDFGYNHANALYIYGYKDGNIYVLKGLYGFEKDTSEWIVLANEQNIPKNITMWCDSAEPDRIQMWYNAGFNAQAVDKGGSKGSVKAQIDWLKGNPEGKDQRSIKRMIYIDSSCTNFIKEIQQWKWKKDQKSNTYLDEPVSFFDDAMASLRYGIEGWRNRKRWLY